MGSASEAMVLAAGAQEGPDGVGIGQEVFRIIHLCDGVELDLGIGDAVLVLVLFQGQPRDHGGGQGSGGGQLEHVLPDRLEGSWAGHRSPWASTLPGRAKNKSQRILQAWPRPLFPEPNWALGQEEHSPPGSPCPVMPSSAKQSGGVDPPEKASRQKMRCLAE